jgi:hypothetical protein
MLWGPHEHLAAGGKRCIGLLLVLTGLMAAALPSARADDLGGELQRFLYDEATATLHVRSYLLDRQTATPPNLAAQVIGGWVGLQTGWFYDTFQLGAVGYTTQPIWAPQNGQDTSNGTNLLAPGGYGFFTLGQAYVSARWQGQTFTGFRQYVDELEVNPFDDRELPQTFEAYALRGKLEAVNYFAGYVAAVKQRASAVFINMGQAGGAPNVNAGMALGSVKYGSMDKLQLRTSTYYVPDILWSSYSDAGGTIPISEDFKVQLAGQFAVQGSNGLNLLTGQPFGTFWGGARAQAIWGPFSLWGAYTQTGSAAAWKSPYGIWIGYNKQQVLDFDRAGERAYQAGASYDFKGAGLAGLVFLASATYGANAVTPATGKVLSENWEYDLDLRFQADALPVPDWLKPLQLRGRIAYVDQYLNNTVSSLTEYRIVVNYEVTWKGPRR